MSNRTNTAVWSDKYNRWQINVQKDNVRKSFYSSTKGRTGQRETNKKADEWLSTGIVSNKAKIKDVYIQFWSAYYIGYRISGLQ